MGRPRPGQRAAARRRRRPTATASGPTGDPGRSIDTQTGDTVLFSLPRNLMDVPFPPGSPLADGLPGRLHRRRGTRRSGCSTRSTATSPPCTRASSGTATTRAPTPSSRRWRGARAAGGLLRAGQPRRASAASCNAHRRGHGQHQRARSRSAATPTPGIPPTGYLQPGPDQHLDGFHALWFARGRYGADDYQRMERQRCMIDAIINEAKPLNLLRAVQVARRGRASRSSAPTSRRTLLPAFVDLAGKVKDSQVRSVVFRLSDQFFPSNPDYDWVHQKVRRALHPKAKPAAPSTTTPSTPSASPTVDPAEAVDAADTCAYHPVSESVRSPRSRRGPPSATTRGSRPSARSTADIASTCRSLDSNSTDRRGPATQGLRAHPPHEVEAVGLRRRGSPGSRGRAPPAASARSRRSGRRARWPAGPGRGRAARGERANRSPVNTCPPARATLRARSVRRPGRRPRRTARPRAAPPAPHRARPSRSTRSTTTGLAADVHQPLGLVDEQLGAVPGHEHAGLHHHPDAAERRPPDDVLQRLAGHPPPDHRLELVGDARRLDQQGGLLLGEHAAGARSR